MQQCETLQTDMEKRDSEMAVLRSDMNDLLVRVDEMTQEISELREKNAALVITVCCLCN